MTLQRSALTIALTVLLAANLVVSLFGRPGDSPAQEDRAERTLRLTADSVTIGAPQEETLDRLSRSYQVQLTAAGQYSLFHRPRQGAGTQNIDSVSFANGVVNGASRDWQQSHSQDALDLVNAAYFALRDSFNAPATSCTVAIGAIDDQKSANKSIVLACGRRTLRFSATTAKLPDFISTIASVREELR